MVGKQKGAGQRNFYLAVGALLVIGIGTLSWMSTRPAPGARIDTTLAPIPNAGHVIGSDSAIAEVVEFGDFECPGCGSFANLTEPDVRARLVNTGLIRFRFMDFPLDIHPNTRTAHLSSWCAGEQGRFWEMHDAIFMNQHRWNTQATRRPDKVLGDLARQVGVGMDRYEACMDSAKYMPQIMANVREGATRGVGGTPTFFFGKRVYDTPLPYDAFKRFVDTLVAETKAAKPGTKKK